MAVRRFNLDEAEDLLPELTDLLSSLQELKQRHDHLQQQGARAGIKSHSNGHDVDMDSRQAQAGLQEVAQQINALLEKVLALGCEVKGIEDGLVDFRSLVDGREVYLCWKLGETAIDWWHDLDTGFAGRQPLRRDV